MPLGAYESTNTTKTLWSYGISFFVVWEAGSGTIIFSPEEIHPRGGEDSLLGASWSLTGRRQSWVSLDLHGSRQ